MKKIFTTMLLGLMAISGLNAQKEPVEMVDGIKSTFDNFDTTMNLTVMTPLSARFDLIAEAYPDQWIAQYYAGYSKIVMSFVEPDLVKKDLLIDQAQSYLEVIKGLKIENDERYVLEAYIASGRLSVDGEKRWMKQGPIFDKNMDIVKKKNADNVHYYYLKGTSLYFTPKMFGGGGKNAKPYFEKAKELYAKMDKTNILVPYWGHLATDYFLSEIEKEK